MFFSSKIEKDEMIFQLKTLIKEKKDTLSFLDDIEQTIINGPFENEKKYWIFSVRKARYIVNAELSWADECIKELESENE